MNWILSVLIIVILIGAVEKTNTVPVQRVRNSRIYQGSRRRVVDFGSILRGRPPLYVNGVRTSIEDLAARADPTPKPTRETRPTISYAPPAATSGAPMGPAATQASAGVTVDFFHGVLMLINAPYEGPNDALRQLRALSEGGRQWNNGLGRLHQRMADTGDMRIDPFVSDHVVRAAAFGQAMVLELIEADSAMTALLNMTLAELQERGLQIPNTHR